MSTLAEMVAAAAPSVLRPSWAARGYGDDVLCILYSGEMALGPAIARLQSAIDERQVVAAEAARVVRRAGSADVAIYVRTEPRPAPQQGGDQ